MTRRSVIFLLMGVITIMGVEGSQAADAETARATFGGGCFWCTEAVYAQLKGVKKVTSGYIGGSVPNPTYKDVCTGLTGHAEAVDIEYDPSRVTYQQLLEVFFSTHDPTTKNRQGADVGTQYRSGVFYHDDEQKRIAEEVIAKLDQARAFPRPIVTEVTKATTFYPAEDYHQDYFASNWQQPYCQAIVAPKVDKVRKVFKDLVK
ncbi:MAG: peptide-methionine (S)-S-oxide reductase [Planctomycetota bacterium]|nr:MAG: peptide-methionine (S)-S-oxide reductase [Planctomycetota bacterium]